MSIYETKRPFAKLYDAATATTPIETLGSGTARFEGNGTVQNGRLEVTWQGQTAPTLWIEEDYLRQVSASELTPELPPVNDQEFYEDADLAGWMLSDFMGAGGMNAEYLLLLAWAESGWTNTDAMGRDGADADLDGPVGPYRLDKATWSSLLDDTAYGEILRGFGVSDRLKPQVQCFFAAALANRLQRALTAAIPGLDAPAWLLRVGHRIGEQEVVRFAQLADTDIVSTAVGGAGAISAATAKANPKLFPNKLATKKSDVLAAVKAEFESGKRAVIKRLGDLIHVSFVDSMVEGSSPGIRRGALGLLDFIAKYESGGNYNAVVDRAKNENNPRLVTMTIDQVLNYQTGLGGRNACGKYQIVQGTLRSNYAPAGLSGGGLFDPEGQDKIGYHLLMSVRKGDDFLRSPRTQAELEAFALRVAQEWAAMPVLRSMTGHNGVQITRGDSYYSNTAGNKALTSAGEFEDAIRKFVSES